MLRLQQFAPGCFRFLKIAFVIIWLSNLAATDAYISVYAIIAFASFYAIIKQCDYAFRRAEHFALSFTSVLFSVLVLLANYPVFTQVRDPEYIQASTNLLVNALNACFSFAGGIVVAYSLLRFLYIHFKSGKVCSPRSADSGEYLLLIAGSFLLILAVHLIHLFLVEYPGNVTEDPFTQIGEMVTGQYSNFNTFWHTMFLHGILSVGYWLFGNVNAAVAFYCTVQAVIMTASFTLCLGTLYLLGIPVFYLLCSFLMYAVLPYNIALSITIWKDVLFSAGALLMICSVLRIHFNLGRWKWCNYAALAAGCIFFGLSRNNGWYVFLVSLPFFLWSLRKNRKALVLLVASFAVCWTLTNPVLSMLGVSGGDYTESLSIPLQQVARVITDGCELTEEESELISHVFDIEEVPSLYTNWLSDPMKIEFRSNDTDYFEAHVGDYVKLWVNLGLRYPGEYLKAWVDQTKGYWNGGYGYGMYSETVVDNPYGVHKSGGNNLIATLFRLYFGLSRHVIFFEPLHSIGLHVWITALCCLFNLLQKRGEWVLSVPLLVIVFGLCLGTPVYASFRYAYPVFVCIPLVLGSTLYRWSKEM